MAAPTGAEIRGLLTNRAARGDTFASDAVQQPDETPLHAEFRTIMEEIAEPLDWPATYVLDGLAGDPSWGGDPGDALYWDLRRSEAAELRDLLQAAVDRAARRCERIIVDELVRAGVAFAAAHPDAPRPIAEGTVAA